MVQEGVSSKYGYLVGVEHKPYKTEEGGGYVNRMRWENDNRLVNRGISGVGE